MMRKLLPLAVVGILMTPLFVGLADASSYYYTGTAYVSKDYRYVGFTPEKITIKTNVRWDKSIYGSGGLGSIMYKTLNIKLYSWATYPYEHWFIQDEKTYYNTFNNLGGVINQEFTCKAYSYTKSWWDALMGRRYVKFEITIPKDKDFYHHNSGKTKIVVTLKAEGGRYIYGQGFETVYLTVRGTGEYWTNPTPWDKYQKYWGYSASVQEYNELVAQQNTTYVTQPIEFDTLDIALISLFILGVAIISYVFISEKKKGRAW